MKSGSLVRGKEDGLFGCVLEEGSIGGKYRTWRVLWPDCVILEAAEREMEVIIK